MSPRNARHRERQRAGLVVLDVEVHAEQTADLMVMSGHLDPNLADDRDALRRAVEAYLADHAAPPDAERDASRCEILRSAMIRS